MNNLITLSFDPSKIEEQINELFELIKDSPDFPISELTKLPLDVVLGEWVPTIRAGKIVEYVLTCWLGKNFGDFLTTIRTNKRDSHIASLN